jgi:hypothetical protein
MTATSTALLASYPSTDALGVCAQLLARIAGQSAWSSAGGFVIGKLYAGMTSHSASAANNDPYFIERNAFSCANDLPPQLLFRPGKRSLITYERRP